MDPYRYLTLVNVKWIYNNDYCHNIELFSTVTEHYSHDYCHNIELFNTVTEQTLYSHDYCHNIELFNTVTEHSIAMITVTI